MKFSWFEFENSVKNKRIIGYGTGGNAHLMLDNERFQPFIDQLEYFVDTDTHKHGKKFIHKDHEYEIMPVEQLYKESNIVVLVTISDYIQTGQMLEENNTEWFSWVTISAHTDFDKIFSNKDKTKPSLLLMNTPEYINLGDHAITAAEDIYLKQNFGDYYEFGSNSCNYEMIKKLRDNISKKDIIFFQGGGNLGSLWRTNEETFRLIIKEFPDNPVIVFPQSIYYGNSEEEKTYFRISQEIYDSHKNLLICVRDKRSYDFVTNSYNCKCMLLPDMVLTIKYQGISERKGIGVLLRHDKEQVLSDDYENIIDNVIRKSGENKIIIDHHPNKAIKDRKSEIDSLMKQYSQCRLVITDRLHGMILSAVTGTPCIAFDNSYHKVSGLYETWLKNISYITVSEPIPENDLFDLLNKNLSSVSSSYDNSQFMDKYEELTEYVKKYYKPRRKNND